MKKRKRRSDAAPHLGKTINAFTLMEYLGDGYYLSKCVCGAEKKIKGYAVLTGRTKSCGCLTGKRPIKHGLSKHPLMGIWGGMIGRCHNVKDKAYKDYGGRGIFVCKEWRNNFKAFYDWAIANGWEKGLMNDRRDNDKGYSPENCRFVNSKISGLNKRSTVFITYNGLTLCIADWAKKTGIDKSTLGHRLFKMKLPLEQVFSFGTLRKPPIKKIRKHLLLTAEKMSQIKSELALNVLTKKEIAKKYEIGYNTILRIFHNKERKHILK